MPLRACVQFNGPLKQLFEIQQFTYMTTLMMILMRNKNGRFGKGKSF